MGNDASEPDTDRIGRFWSRYIEVTRAFGIPQKAQPWYRKHVERFIDAHSGLRLAYCSTESVADRQLRQRADSLRLFLAHPEKEATSLIRASRPETQGDDCHMVLVQSRNVPLFSKAEMSLSGLV